MLKIQKIQAIFAKKQKFKEKSATKFKKNSKAELSQIQSVLPKKFKPQNYKIFITNSRLAVNHRHEKAFLKPLFLDFALCFCEFCDELFVIF